MNAAVQPEGREATQRLVTLTLRDFRNIERADLAFPADGVAVIGDNGEGKTNLLEAIAYRGTLRSLRNARDRDLVRHGTSVFHLHAAIDDGVPREISIGLERTSGRKRISVDGVVVARQTDALGVLRSVAWSPADVALVAGGPGERRRYLDVMLAVSSRAYVHALRQYRGALERRNATLRGPQRGDSAAVAAWEPALAHYGGALVETRSAWVEAHHDEFVRLCAAIGERSPARLGYSGDAAAQVEPATALADALRRERDRDVVRGMTCVGPHRDDLTITLDGRDARTFGSAGQQRSAAIALRLLEARTLGEGGRAHPVLLFDDPFAELDATRTERTLDVLMSEAEGQVVLAVPRESEIPSRFAHLTRWRVSRGTFAT